MRSQSVQGLQDKLKIKALQSQAGSTTDVSGDRMPRPVQPVKERVPPFLHTAPQETLEIFNAESRIKGMINDAVHPLHVKLPCINSDIKQLQNEIRNVAGVLKQQAAAMSCFEEGMAALRENERLVKGIEQTFVTTKVALVEHQHKQEMINDRFSGRFEEIDKRARDDRAALDRRFAVFEQNYNTIDHMQNRFIARYDEMFKTVDSDRQKTESRLLKYETAMEEFRFLAARIREDLATETKKGLDEMYALQQREQNTIHEVKQQLKELKGNKHVLKMLENQLADCLEKAKDQLHLQTFASKSLPILMHLQICEALDKVVGDSHSKQLLSYEKAKNKVVHFYSREADFRCIKIMNEKLPLFAQFMCDSEMGCMPFIYGDDVSPTLPPEQRYHIDQSHKLRLRQRYDDLLRGQQSVQDAAAFLIRDGVQNGVMVDFKLKKLNRPALMIQLREALAEHKIMNLKNYEDLDVQGSSLVEEQIEMLRAAVMELQHNQYNANQGRRGDAHDRSARDAASSRREYTRESAQPKIPAPAQQLSLPSARGNPPPLPAALPTFPKLSAPAVFLGQPTRDKNLFGGASSLNRPQALPDKLFLVRTDALKPYQRFEQRFAKMFQDCLENFEAFKKTNMQNFADQAHVLAEIGVQLDGMREQISDTQDQIEETDTRHYEASLKQRQETATQFEQVDKRANDQQLLMEQAEHAQAGVDRHLRELQGRHEAHVVEYQQESLKVKDQLLKNSDGLGRVSVKLEQQIAFIRTELRELRSSIEDQVRKIISDKVQSSAAQQALRSKLSLKVVQEQMKQDKEDIKSAIDQKAVEQIEATKNLTALAQQTILQETSTQMTALEQRIGAVAEEVATTTVDAAVKQNQLHAGPECPKAAAATPEAPTSPAADDSEEKEEKPASTATFTNRGLASLNLKQAEKVKLQRQQEEKRKKAELAKQKQKEREERAELVKKEHELRRLALKKQQDQEDEQKRLLEERKQEQERRRQRKQRFQSNTAALALSQKLVKSLAVQQKQDTAASDQMTKMQKSLTKGLASKVNDELTKIHSREKKQNSKKVDNSKAYKGQAKGSLINEISHKNDAEDDFESDQEDRLVRGGIDKAAVIELVDERIKEAKIAVNKMVLEEIGRVTAPVEKIAKQMEDKLKESSEQIEATTQSLSEQVAALKIDHNDYKKESAFQIKGLEDMLGTEQHGIRRQKVELKGQIQVELAKLDAQNTKTNYEFMRLNSFVFNSQQILNGVLEDLMIMQLVLEQDVKDRQQIGLFGVKKNSEILGVNQNAVTNNYQKAPLSTSEHQNPGVWDMPNKNKTYQEVTKESTFKHEKQTQLVNQQLMNIGPLQGAARPQLIEADPIPNKYNVLTVSRDCASCHGFAPQILSQIKLACLSYTNSPIVYADGASLSVDDMLKVKEAILKNVERANASLSQFLANNGSNFGLLGTPHLDIPRAAPVPTHVVHDFPQVEQFGNQSSQKIETLDQANADVQSQPPYHEHNYGSDPQLAGATPIFSKFTSKGAKLQKTVAQNRLRSDAQKTLTNSEHKHYSGYEAASPADSANFLAPMANEPSMPWTGSLFQPMYLNPKLKYNIPALTKIMLANKDKESKSNTNEQVEELKEHIRPSKHNQGNHPTLQVSEQDLQGISQTSLQQLQVLHGRAGTTFQRMKSSEISKTFEHRDDLLQSKVKEKRRSAALTSYMTRRVNFESQKFQNIKDNLIDADQEQLLTQLKEEYDSAQSRQMLLQGDAQAKTFSTKGKSNSIIQTFKKPTTGSLMATDPCSFSGLTGSKLAAQRVRSKLESQQFMLKRGSRGGSQQRAATITSHSKTAFEEQRFPQVEYQQKMFTPGAQNSHFSKRAASFTRATGHANAKQLNKPMLVTLSGNTEFQTHVTSDGNQQPGRIGPLSPQAPQHYVTSPIMINNIVLQTSQGAHTPQHHRHDQRGQGTRVTATVSHMQHHAIPADSSVTIAPTGGSTTYQQRDNFATENSPQKTGANHPIINIEEQTVRYDQSGAAARRQSTSVVDQKRPTDEGLSPMLTVLSDNQTLKREVSEETNVQMMQAFNLEHAA